MTLGMVLTIQGKVPLALDESKENITWHQQVRGFRMENEAHVDLKNKN